MSDARPFAVFDIDGTVIRWQLYHAIVNELIARGALDEHIGAEIQAARMNWKRRSHEESFRTYEKVLVHAYESAVTGLKVTDFKAAIDAVFDEYKDQVYRYSRDLITSVKEQGYTLLAISGSHQEIVGRLAEYYGFDDAVGQVYEQKDGRFTGNHTTPMYHKDVVLKELVAKHDLDCGGSIALGDSESDIPMLAAVERPIAFNPSRGLFAEAQQRQWDVVLERKNMIYELKMTTEGYRLTPPAV